MFLDRHCCVVSVARPREVTIEILDEELNNDAKSVGEISDES